MITDEQAVTRPEDDPFVCKEAAMISGTQMPYHETVSGDLFIIDGKPRSLPVQRFLNPDFAKAMERHPLFLTKLDYLVVKYAEPKRKRNVEQAGKANNVEDFCGS